jgi:hypothetical protein
VWRGISPVSWEEGMWAAFASCSRNANPLTAELVFASSKQVYREAVYLEAGVNCLSAWKVSYRALFRHQSMNSLQTENLVCSIIRKEATGIWQPENKIIASILIIQIIFTYYDDELLIT